MSTTRSRLLAIVTPLLWAAVSRMGRVIICADALAASTMRVVNRQKKSPSSFLIR